MNVSESVDWKTIPFSELAGLRFIARTVNGQTLDGTLVYAFDPFEGRCMCDSDRMRTVFIQDANGHAVLNVNDFISVNVVREPR